MVPKSHLYVYFIRDGDFMCQEMPLSFPREFQNKVRLAIFCFKNKYDIKEVLYVFKIAITAPKKAKPGEEVTINITTTPNSFVGLLGVDQSVLLLKSGNDWDPNQIINDLSSYDTSTHSSYDYFPGKSSGLVTITNANYPIVPSKFYI